MKRFLFCLAGLGWALSAPGNPEGVYPHTEFFAQAANWKVGGSAMMLSQTNSTLVGMFGWQEFPVPERSSFMADAMASVGRFVGDYASGGIQHVGFSFMAGNVLPSELTLRFQSPTGAFFCSLKPYVETTGVWYQISVSLESREAGNWLGVNEEEFEEVLGHVTNIQVGLTRSGSDDQQYYLGSFFVGGFPGPVSHAATNVTANGFHANWEAVGGATNYLLDVSRDNKFASYVGGFENLPVGDVQTVAVSGLNPCETCYYRVRAQKNGETSGNSETITVMTFQVSHATGGVILSNLAQYYDGTPRSVTVTTEPEGLAYFVTYNGATDPPVARGSYEVVATLDDPIYEGSATGTLIVAAWWMKPDFVVTEITMSPVPDLPGDRFSAYVTVLNKGDIPGDAGVLRVFVSQPGVAATGQPGDGEAAVGLLGVNGMRTFAFEDLAAPGKAGTHHFRAYIDADNITGEKSEGNNQ